MGFLITRTSIVAGGGGSSDYLYGPNADYDPGPVTHYVDPTKTSNGTGLIGDPYQPSQAMALSTGGSSKVHCLWSAGQTASLASTSSRFSAVLSPANSGSSSFRIVHRAANPAAYNSSGQTIIRHNGNTQATGCPAFGCDGVDYVIWDGFYVTAASAKSYGDSGHAVLHDADNCEIHRCHIVGENYVMDSPDNYNGFRTERTLNMVLKNNKVVGVKRSDLNHNGGALMTYGCLGMLVTHNDFSDTNCNIFVKGSANGGADFNSGEICFNKLYTTRENVIIQVIDPDGIDFHHNLSYDYYEGIKVESAVGESPDYVRIYLNTFGGNLSAANSSDNYQLQYDPLAVFTNQEFTRNIVYLGGRSSSRYVYIPANFSGANYNLYYNGASGDRWETDEGLHTTIGAYRTAVTGEANSAVGDPSFVGAGNFTLSGGAGLTLGPGSTQVGCYGPGSEEPGLEV